MLSTLFNSIGIVLSGFSMAAVGSIAPMCAAKSYEFPGGDSEVLHWSQPPTRLPTCPSQTSIDHSQILRKAGVTCGN